MVPQNIKSGLITGGSATLGGMCGGPVGLLLGGAVGGTVAALSCKDKCVEVKDLLVALNYSGRMQVYDAFEETLQSALERSRNYSELSAKIEKNLDLKHDVLRLLKEFIVKEWKLTIFDPRVHTVPK